MAMVVGEAALAENKKIWDACNQQVELHATMETGVRKRQRSRSKKGCDQSCDQIFICWVYERCETYVCKCQDWHGRIPRLVVQKKQHYSVVCLYLCCPLQRREDGPRHILGWCYVYTESSFSQSRHCNVFFTVRRMAFIVSTEL